MSKPEIGNLIEPSVPADVSECSIEDGCNAVLAKGNVPRALIMSPKGHKHIVDWEEEQDTPSKLADILRKFGLVLMLNEKYEEDEWAISDLVPGKDGNTYWNPGI